MNNENLMFARQPGHVMALSLRELMQTAIDSADATNLKKFMDVALSEQCLGELMAVLWADSEVPNAVIELMMPDFLRIFADRQGAGKNVVIQPDEEDYLYNRGLKDQWRAVYAVMKSMFGDDW